MWELIEQTKVSPFYDSRPLSTNKSSTIPTITNWELLKQKFKINDSYKKLKINYLQQNGWWYKPKSKDKISDPRKNLIETFSQTAYKSKH